MNETLHPILANILNGYAAVLAQADKEYDRLREGGYRSPEEKRFCEEQEEREKNR